MIRGDLGDSLRSGRPVVEEIQARLPTTLRLTAMALLISIAFAFPLGLMSAAYPRSVFARLVDSASLSSSLPVYWLGLLLILVFAVNLRWAPAGRL